MTPDWQSLSYSAAPSSGFNSASLCSPIFGAARAQRAGRAGQARHDGMRRQLAHLLVRHLDQRFALQHVVVLHDLGDVVDRADGDAGLVEELQVGREIALGDEAADDGVELQAVANTLDVGGELGILHQLGPADLDQHALGHALGRGRQAHPVPILGLVDVARRGIGRAAARALLHLAGELVVGGLRAQHREQRDRTAAGPSPGPCRRSFRPRAAPPSPRRSRRVPPWRRRDTSAAAPARGRRSRSSRRSRYSLRSGCRSPACGDSGRPGPSPRCAR